MSKIKLTKNQAKSFLLYHQKLLNNNLTGKTGTLQYIQHVNCIQYDPLNIVGRNPDLVLQSRITDYSPSFLDELLYSDRALLDGFDKVMSIYPVEDFPYFQRLRDSSRNRYHIENEEIKNILPFIHEELEQRGPLSSIQIETDKKIRWPWGPANIAKAALESMYLSGDLVIHHKVNTRKIYDFAHKHLPSNILNAPDPNTSLDDFYTWRVERRIGSLGLLWNKASDAWIGINGLKTKERNYCFKRLIDENKITEIEAEGIDYPLYARRKDIDNFNTDIAFVPETRILAPLDNLLWDRKLIKALFDFEYVWEVYKPVEERKHGYYVLPVLYGDKFIARFEPGKDKKSNSMIIKNWWWEENVEADESMLNSIKQCFDRFKTAIGFKNIVIDKKLAKKNNLNKTF